jgi:hypothetical protein
LIFLYQVFVAIHELVILQLKLLGNVELVVLAYKL